MSNHKKYTFQLIGNYIAQVICECGAVLNDYSQIFQHRMEEQFLGGSAEITYLPPVEIIRIDNG